MSDRFTGGFFGFASLFLTGLFGLFLPPPLPPFPHLSPLSPGTSLLFTSPIDDRQDFRPSDPARSCQQTSRHPRAFLLYDPAIMPLTLSDGRRLEPDRPRIMGILNVTPDSFSDGGQYLDPDAALAHAMAMIEQGADIIDVGGESTRPGAPSVWPDEQIRRTVPAIQRLAEKLSKLASPVPISIDTTSPQVAQAALDAGASIINDIHAGQTPGMWSLAAERQCPIILMHMQGTPQTMQQQPVYRDVVAEVKDFLLRRTDAALAMGISPDRIVLDVGIGFGKTLEHNLTLLAALPEFARLGYPLLLGASRKRFLKEILQTDRPTVAADASITSLAVMAGASIIRVHDVPANRQAADVAWAIARRRRGFERV